VRSQPECEAGAERSAELEKKEEKYLAQITLEMGGELPPQTMTAARRSARAAAGVEVEMFHQDRTAIAQNVASTAAGKLKTLVNKGCTDPAEYEKVCTYAERYARAGVLNRTPAPTFSQVRGLMDAPKFGGLSC